MVVVLLQPFTFSPNLFYSTSLICSTYLMQVERVVEVDQAESYKPCIAYEEARSFFHHNHSLLLCTNR
jgi:hypothetical protein